MVARGQRGEGTPPTFASSRTKALPTGGAACLADGLMRVTRGQIIVRGLTHRCPNCGEKKLFQPGTLFTLNRECPICGLKIERDEGGFLAAMSLNYGVTLVGFLSPVALLWHFGVLGGTTAAVLAGVGAVVVPLLLYRPSRCWGLANYYFLFPHHLPANRDPRSGPAGDQND